MPREPGQRLYADVSLSLSDDLGTDYRWESSAVGGTGRLFRRRLALLVCVPAEATRLLVEAQELGGESGSYELMLGEHS